MLHDVDITVHHFHVGICSSSSTNLLDRARGLVDAATDVADWHSVKPPKPTISNLKHRAACYVWARAPPTVSWVSTTAQLPNCLEWDAPLEEDVDGVDVSTLPDFENTDFSDLLGCKPPARNHKARSRSPSLSTRHFADDVDVNLHSRIRKRQRSCSGAQISISTLIPFPHYYDSPDPAYPPPPEIERIPAFRISRGITVSLPFARSAWLVPLRGCPPYDGASSASLFSSDILALSGLPPESQSPICIKWTPLAITQFWSFMLRQRSMNNFGPLALSYTFGPSHSERRKGRPREYSCNENEQGERTNAWEYIKIYHDGQYALKLRSLLDIFRWEDGVPDASRRNRVLKGARLVLVDERGEATILA